PACIARPAPEANRTLALLAAWIEPHGNMSSDADQCSCPTRENPQEDALRPSFDAVATIPFAPESHPATGRQAVPRVPLATEQFFDALPSKRVQRTNLAERYQLRFLQFRDTADQIINPLERALPPLRHNLVGGRLPQPPDVTEPDAQTWNILVPFNRVLDGAVPFGIEGVDWFHSKTMQLRIVHQHCRAVKTHRLIVE